MTRISFALDDSRYRHLEEVARKTGASPVDVARIAVEEYLSRNISERAEWLKEKRKLAEERIDRLFAPNYDASWGEIDASHISNLEEFLSMCPKSGFILDAACGTGKYWSFILERGFRLAGTDQAKEMLVKANAKNPSVSLEKVGLQELAYSDVFDGIICMDAMEYVSPEDWPLVLRNFHRALRTGGHLYCTVEEANPAELHDAYVAATMQKLPVVDGEWAFEDGYHFYPTRDQVDGWVADAKLSVVSDTAGDDYRHLIMQKS